MNTVKRLLMTAMIPFMSMSLSSCNYYGVYADADKYLVGSQTYEGELKDLNIDWVSGSVTVIEDKNANVITVTEDNDLPDKKKVHSYFHDGILNVKFAQSGLVGSFADFDFSSKKKLYVTYPSAENLRINITSGSLNDDLITTKNVKINITSGKAEIGAIESESVKLNMTSGSAVIDNLTTKTGDFGLTSGSITIKKSLVESLDFNVTSGNINLTIPEKGATIDFHKTSGKYNSEREYDTVNGKYVYGDGSAQIKINVTSGTTNIK